MESLPIVPPSCTLDEAGLRQQLFRYRVAGAGAEVVVHDARKIAIRVGEDTDPALIDELISVERSCCPFYDLTYDTDGRLLTIAVTTDEHEPALAAIAFALGLTAETGRFHIALD
jgi:hypothetical protein